MHERLKPCHRTFQRTAPIPRHIGGRFGLRPKILGDRAAVPFWHF
jgi:hypothetical protein